MPGTRPRKAGNDGGKIKGPKSRDADKSFNSDAIFAHTSSGIASRSLFAIFTPLQLPLAVLVFCLRGGGSSS